MIYVVVGSVLAVLGVWFGLTCYWKLWHFARECQQARIVIARKGRVVMQPPILEWLLWARQLEQDKERNGTMIFNYNGTSISVIKKSFGLKTPVHEFVAWLLRRAKFDKTWGYQNKKGATPLTKDVARARSGRWKAKDQTVTDVTRNNRDT